MSTESILISLAILSSSFWGSWHCAAMCGPVASVIARRGSLWSYHSGRGISYIFMGIAGGFLGSFFLKSEFEIIRILSGLIFGVLLIVMGLQTLRGLEPFASPKLNWMHSMFNKSTPGFMLGLLSVFLPCGWLYSYVFASVATQSPLSGGIVMLLFWLGGLPALSALSLFVKQSIQITPKRKQFAAGCVLIFAGAYSVVSFYFFTNFHN